MAGSAVVGALRVNLTLATAAFTEGLRQSQASLKKFGNDMAGVGKGMTARLTVPLAAAAGGVAASLGLISSGLADIKRQSGVANASVEEFQRWAAGARTVGIENDKLADILKDVNDRVGDFLTTGGGEMKDFFDTIAPKVGVTAEQFKGLSGPQALQLYVSSLEKAGLNQQEMTFYLEAMADEATALIPLLANGGAEIQRLGDRAAELGIANDKAIESGARFQQSLQDLAAAGRGLGIALMESGILDAVTQIIQKVTGFVASLGDLDPRIVQFGVVLAGLAAAVGPVVAAVGLMVAALGSLPIAAVVAGLTALTAGAIAFWPEIVRAKDALVSLANDGIAWVQTNFGGLLEFMRDLPAQFAQIGRDIMQGLLSGIRERWQAVKDTFTGLGTDAANWVREKLGIQSPSTVFAEIGRNIMQGLSGGVQSLTGGVRDEVEGFADRLASSFASVLTGATKFRDALRQTLASTLANYASSLATSGISGLFGAIGQAIGIPGFASGTSFAPGGLAWVGERGPELVDLPRGSKVYSAARSAAMGGQAFGGPPVQVEIVPTPYFDAVVDRRAAGVAQPLVGASARAQQRAYGPRAMDYQRRGTN